MLFQFTRKLDDLLGFLYDDREADTVETAQEALRQLQEKVDAIGIQILLLHVIRIHTLSINVEEKDFLQ